MFTSLSYLQSVSTKQRIVFEIIHKLEIMNDLESYNPVLCGTIPIEVDTTSFDLDIVMEVHDFDAFERTIQSLYGRYERRNYNYD